MSIDILAPTLSNLAHENKMISIIGDFNIDLLKYDNNAPSNEFINMMFSFNFQPTILHPTRITDSSSTIIDNIYVNNATESNIFAGNILSQISDHLPYLPLCVRMHLIIKLPHFLPMTTNILMK